MIGHDDRIRIDVRITPDQLREQLRNDVRRGLSEHPKRLAAKWHYDETGSRLFDEITRQPEYYPTGREREILTARVDEIAALSRAETLIELGSGTGDKTRLLLTALQDAGGLRRFVPFDVSEEVLRESAIAILETYPGIEVCGIVGDFERHLDALPLAGRGLVAFLGGTIGNLLRPERARLLAALSGALGDGGLLLLGADLVKPRARLEAAYNDTAGVSARFTLNLLAVLNRELGADFDRSRFRHDAVWNEARECMDIGVVSLCAQRVTIAELGMAIDFADGEKLHTEISAKFRPEGLTAELTAAGFDQVRFWTDAAGEFSLSLWSRAAMAGSQVAGEHQLVAERDAVHPGLGDLRLQLARALQRTGIQRHQPEAAPLVEAKRAHVVVGRDQLHLPAPGGARRLDGALEQCGADAHALLDGVQRDDLTLVALGDVGDQALDLVAVGEGHEPRQLVDPVHPAPGDGPLGTPAQTAERGHPVAVTIHESTDHCGSVLRAGPVFAAGRRVVGGSHEQWADGSHLRSASAAGGRPFAVGAPRAARG